MIRARLLLVLAASLSFSSHASAQCVGNSTRELRRDGAWLWSGVVEAPRNAIRAHNLKWELPIAAATSVLIATGDTPASRQIKSLFVEHQASRWSNIGMALELGGAGATYALGCAERRETVRGTAQIALEAAGAATVFNFALKKATNRQRPSANNSSGEYWEGGTSFPSGHAAASFAVASAIAHRTQRRWLKFAVYGLAAGVSLGRYPAKAHFFSDIVVGGTLGYITGAYLATPHPAIH
jgi:membrane-associated phospholipid phosphatase